MGLGTLLHEIGVRPEVVTGHDFRGASKARDGGGYRFVENFADVYIADLITAAVRPNPAMS